MRGRVKAVPEEASDARWQDWCKIPSQAEGAWDRLPGDAAHGRAPLPLPLPLHLNARPSLLLRRASRGDGAPGHGQPAGAGELRQGSQHWAVGLR
jgi:hypothetical protein